MKGTKIRIGSVRDGEAALVERLRARDEAAFEELVEGHRGRLLAVTRRLLRSEEDARDAVQEAFLSAWRSIEGFEGLSRLSTWLHRIAVNVALMKLRSRGRRPEADFGEVPPGGLRRPGEEGADAILERRETRELVRRSLERLPRAHRTVLYLRDIEELDTAHVAGRLGLTANAVKVRLHRARRALRGLIAPDAA